MPLGTLIIRGSQDHALVGPLENQALTKEFFVGAFSFRSNLETFIVLVYVLHSLVVGIIISFPSHL